MKTPSAFTIAIAAIWFHAAFPCFSGEETKRDKCDSLQDRKRACLAEDLKVFEKRGPQILKLQFAIARSTQEDGDVSVVFTNYNWPQWVDLSFPVDGDDVRAIGTEGQVIAPRELPNKLARKTFVGLVLLDEVAPFPSLATFLEKLPPDGIVFCVSHRRWKAVEDAHRFMREHSSELSDAADSR
jgi:hypothetical protein